MCFIKKIVKHILFVSTLKSTIVYLQDTPINYHTIHSVINGGFEYWYAGTLFLVH